MTSSHLATLKIYVLKGVLIKPYILQQDGNYVCHFISSYHKTRYLVINHKIACFLQ